MTAKQITNKLAKIYEQEKGVKPGCATALCGYAIQNFRTNEVIMIDVLNQEFNTADARNPHATNRKLKFSDVTEDTMYYKLLKTIERKVG